MQALAKYYSNFLHPLIIKITASKKLLLAITLLFFVPVFALYYKQAVTFHFIDEYNNFMAGYFLLKGKMLYSQIFFQHQPLMAYISFFLQKILHPNTLYTLVLYHRIFVVVVALLFDLLIVFRFRVIGLGFVYVFELTKYYLFGSTFLAESIVVYPLVYLLGLMWDVLLQRKITTLDLWLGSIFAWFVIFMREPYIPTAIILYALIVLLVKQPLKTKIGPVLLILFLSSVTFVTLPLHDYLFEIINVNTVAVASPEIQSAHLSGLGIVSIFIYPLIILFQGLLNYFRGILVLIDFLFLLTLYAYIGLSKQWKNGLILLLILGVTNIRITPPGTLFFGAYHMLVWYGLFIFSTFLLISRLSRIKHYAQFHLITSVLLVLLCVYILLPTNSFLWTKLDKITTFTTNYGQYYTNGEIVHNLAGPQTTFFVDGWDSLMYWQADQQISYPFLFYYPPMSYFPIYTQARARMFAQAPPEFVYTDCKVKKNKVITPTFNENRNGGYAVFYFGKQPTCLFIKKSAINTITKTQWDSIKAFGYYLKS